MACVFAWLKIYVASRGKALEIQVGMHEAALCRVVIYASILAGFGCGVTGFEGVSKEKNACAPVFVVLR